MSGSTLGGFVGGVIGFVASGYTPAGFQYGWVIGPACGEFITPCEVEYLREPATDMA